MPCNSFVELFIAAISVSALFWAGLRGIVKLGKIPPSGTLLAPIIIGLVARVSRFSGHFVASRRCASDALKRPEWGILPDLAAPVSAGRVARRGLAPAPVSLGGRIKLRIIGRGER